MAKKSINPFQNESETIQIGDLSIENRLDRVSFFGGLDITKDKAGLVAAKELKEILDTVVKRLEKEELPDQVVIEPSHSVKIPFS
jgi:hypothetical protein